ncbi:MAG TPA: nuclear transport factor 2 family protein, partial [Edaphobacter sp.]
MRKQNRFIPLVLTCLLLLDVCRLEAQLSPTPSPIDALGQKGPTLNPLTQPTLSPEVIHLLELEGQFSQAVAAGGGKAFAQWFAEDAVVLNNGQPATLGRGAITAQAQWNPKDYQLTWTPQGAQMGPSNDMGFTWGHYEGHSKDKNGQPVVISGRYITVWKKIRTEAGRWPWMRARMSLPPQANAVRCQSRRRRYPFRWI